MIVADTNLLVYLFLPGPYHPLAEKAFKKDRDWITPFLWRSEFRSVLAKSIRQNLLTLSQAQAFMQNALLFMRGREYHPLPDDVLYLVAHSGCSAYDCEFVAIAQEMGIPLVSLDKQILKEFPQFTTSLETLVA